MDGTRLGITFEEAQTVVRNIRERNLEKFNQGYSQPFGKGYNKGGDVLLNRGCSSSSSPYFKTTFRDKRDNHDLHRRILPNDNLRSEQRTEETLSHSGLSLQPFVPKTCSIAERLQSLKESRVREPQGYSYQASSVKQPAVSNLDANEYKQSSSTSKSVQSDYCNDNLKRERNIQDSKPSAPPVKSKKLSTENNMDITSYLPKVKHPRTTRPLIKTTTAKKQTKIHDFGSPAPHPSKTNTVSMESMSKEERESLRTKIFSATNIACTLVYTTGNTLVRPNSAKNSVKGICIAFPNEDQQLSEKNTFNIENCHCVFVPVSVFEKEWSRAFFISLMEADNNKIIYDAQKFIKALISLLTIEDHSVCFRWQCFDPKIAAWLLDPDHPPEDFDVLLLTELGKDSVLASQGKADSSEVKKIKKENNSNDQLYHDMFSLLSLMPRMFLSLQNKNLWELFSEVEMKICPILAVMELLGVEIDTQLLFSYGNILQKKSQKLEQEGFKIVGHPFQMSSTQQLRQILFNELQLDKNVNKKLARTQIKNYKSTAENVLKHLQDYHPLPKIVLEYRHVSKLKSAYVDGILSFVENGTLHTNWNQTSTATGRLTSTNPNIQAIPRNQLDITGVTEQFIIGKEVETFSIVPRQAFKSRAGWTFLSADFQSIELRLLAHFSEDPLLLQIFNQSEDDIFIQLASLWLSLDPKSIQSEQRERAKRVVYSVIYGVGKERLAETLGVSAEEAKTFTNSFLATFPGLKKFIQTCVNRCRSQGYVTTIFGRQRLLPAINSNELHLRSQSERQAVNFVIQGSAADICKMGMILVVRSLSEKFKLDARLLIQIHDELVLEVRDSHMQDVKELVKSCLEDTKALCAGHVRLKVNFKVSLSCGKTWADMQSLK